MKTTPTTINFLKSIFFIYQGIAGGMLEEESFYCVSSIFLIAPREWDVLTEDIHGILTLKKDMSHDQAYIIEISVIDERDRKKYCISSPPLPYESVFNYFNGTDGFPQVDHDMQRIKEIVFSIPRIKSQNE